MWYLVVVKSYKSFQYRVSEIIEFETIRPYCLIKFLEKRVGMSGYLINSKYIDAFLLLNCIKRDCSVKDIVKIIQDEYPFISVSVDTGFIIIEGKGKEYINIEFAIARIDEVINIRIYKDKIGAEIVRSTYVLAEEVPYTLSEVKKFNTLSEFFEDIARKQYIEHRNILEDIVKSLEKLKEFEY